MTHHNCDCHKTEKEGNGFMAGIVMGMFIGGLAGYIYGAPDGKKRAKELLEKSEELIGSLEEKYNETKGAVGEKVHDYMESHGHEHEKHTSFAANIKKKFFKKGGRELNALW